MATRRKIRADEAQLSFEALSIEGALLSPEWLSKVAQLSAAAQAETDYRVPKGLNLRDEIGRYWRIAQALWTDYAAGLAAKADRELLAENFVTSLLRDCFGFASLARIGTVVVSDRNYPIGQIALGRRVPVVIAPAASGIDTLSPLFADGGRRRSAFGVAQEYLNAEAESLWGIATDGSTLRILRDNASLTRPAWIEADLARIFIEERYADFAALWLVAHETRFGRDGQAVTDCALEAWRNAGREEGTRAREHLRGGVEDALVALGQGFLSHPDNQALRAALQDGSLTTRDYFSQLLRLVYRLIFLLTVEERDLLHSKSTSEAARSLYARGYGLRRLSEKSVRRNAHDRHADLWESIKVVLRGLAVGESRLGLPALAGIFAANQCPALDTSRLENRALVLAVFKLAWLRDDGALVRVNWRDMGPEELGSVYESLLELVPQLTEQGRKFSFVTAAGNERKTTGSYYTPTSLIECLLDSALKPVIDERLAGKLGSDAEDAILSIRVCDPACGSGHFLIAAAHRLARRLASIRAENEQPSLAELRHALRDVIGHCIYGVDLNPMAVELCKITLWLEALEPGKPLSFLDHHIQCGNSLLGATPGLMAKGIPDEAFEPIEGDEKPVCSALKKLNARQREGFGVLFGKEDEAIQQHLRAAVAAIDQIDDSSADGIARKEVAYASSKKDALLQRARDLADLWCAAFVIPKSATSSFPAIAPTSVPEPAASDPIMSQSAFRGFDVPVEKPSKATKKAKPNSVPQQDLHGITSQHLRDFASEARLPEGLLEEARSLSRRYHFFHWHLAFPEVFQVPSTGQKPENPLCGWTGGFDVNLCNPPWERIKIEERAWFEARAPQIANATNSNQRKRLICELIRDEPELLRQFQAAKRDADSIAQLLARTGLFPLGASGDLNTFSVFADLSRILLAKSGRAGFVTPTSLLSDYTYRSYFSYIMRENLLRRVVDFTNKERLFADVDSNQKFSLVTIGAGDDEPRFSFGLLRPSDAMLPENQILLSIADIELVNPNTQTCPAFQSTRDAILVKKIYQEIPVLRRDDDSVTSGWDLDMWTMFHMANDSGYFFDAESSDFTSGGKASDLVRLYEGKMIQQFDHRFSHAGKPLFEGGIRGSADHLSSSDKDDPHCVATARYLTKASEVSLRAKGFDWFIGYREIAGAVANVRTMTAAILPRVAVGNKILLFGVRPKDMRGMTCCLLANLNAFVFDYVLRQKLTGMSLSFYIVKQIPTLPPLTFKERCPWALSMEAREWLLPRVLELSYTAWDVEAFALESGWSGPPFHWDEERRLLLRCELDAAFFHLYGLSREDTAYIMDTFPIVRRKDEARTEQTDASGEVIQPGRYITKDTILEIYDAIADSINTSQPYQTRLNPPPADPRCCHPPKR